MARFLSKNLINKKTLKKLENRKREKIKIVNILDLIYFLEEVHKFLSKQYMKS